MIIVELKIFLNSTFIIISEYMDSLILTLFNQIPKNGMQLGDIIFLIIVCLFVLSIVLSIVSLALSKIMIHKKVGLESYYLDQVAIQLKKNSGDSGGKGKSKVSKK